MQGWDAIKGKVIRKYQELKNTIGLALVPTGSVLAVFLGSLSLEQSAYPDASWELVLLMFPVIGPTIVTFKAFSDNAVPNVIAVPAIMVSGILAIMTFANLHYASGVLSNSQTIHLQEISGGYWDALYFSVVTFTTLGYGDLQPVENLRLLAAAEALFGYIYLGMFVSVLFQTGSRKAGPKA